MSSKPLPERSRIRSCAGRPMSPTGRHEPLTARSRTGPPWETCSAHPARLLAMAGSSEAGTTPTALHLATSLVRLAGAVGELRQAQQHAAQAEQRGRRPKACTPRSAGRGRAPLRWASPPRRGRTRPSASPQTQPGPIFRSRSSLGHSRHKAAVTSPRSHPRDPDLRRTLPRVRVLAGEPSQSSHDPPHRATASRSTRSRFGSFRPQGVATRVMTPGSSFTPRANPAGLASRSPVLRCQGCSDVEKAILATTTP